MGKKSKKHPVVAPPTAAAPCPPASFANLVTWIAFAILALIVYSPALTGSLLWDDDGHVTPAALRSLEGLQRIWFEPGASQQYYPVLHSAFWLEHRLWGDWPAAYHGLNVLLHATAAWLVVLATRCLNLRGGWLAGLVFLLHPVCVESVAWISEQKNTLSLVFYLLAALAYFRFEAARFPAIGEISRTERATAWRFYALASVLFGLAVLTKTVTATLPATLLVIAWWRRGKISWRDVAPLLPWFIFGLVSGLVTAWVERDYIGARGADYGLDFLQRAVLAGRVVWFYLGKLLWPTDLAFVYPRWRIDASSAAQYLGLFGAVVVLMAAWFNRARSRAPLAATLIFGGSLFPALGFINVFPFVYSYVADHFQYLACLAVIVPVSVLLVRWLWSPTSLPAWLGRTVIVALLVTLGTLTWRQAHDYRDNISLYRATLARNPNAAMAAYNLGLELKNRGEVDAAIASYENALAIKPDYAEVHANLAMALLAQHRLDDAAAHFRAAMRLKPALTVAEVNLGNVLLAQGRFDEAAQHYEHVLHQAPDSAEVHANVALAYLQLGRREEAIRHLEIALRLKPDLPGVRQLLDRARQGP